MYRVIIVDDEDEVRVGIKRKTDWAACGFELVGDFNNGRDLLEAVESLQPDIVITDICMPFMDGLEMTEHLINAYRDLKVVILTGYEDFDYAKQAIKLKVKDYLIKPVNSEEFTEFLLKMKHELDDEHSKKANFSELKLRLNQSMPLLRERFLERLVTSRMDLEEIERKFSYFDLWLPGPYYLALIADIDVILFEHTRNEDADTVLLRFAVLNIMQEIFEKESGGIVFQTRDDKIAVIYSGDADLEEKAQLLAGYAAKSVHKYLKLTISMGIGRVYASLQRVSNSFQEALSSLDYRFLLGKNKIISIKDLEYGKSVDQVTYKDWEKKVVAAMKTGNKDKVSAVLDDGIEEWKAMVPSIDKCYGSIHKLLVSLMNLIVDTGFDESHVFDDNPFSQIRTMKTLDDVRDWLQRICHQIIQYLSQHRTAVAHSQMAVAEAYMKEHYAKESLSLNEVCSQVFMSSSYFSLLFKQYSGVTFVDYLTQYRLEKAKELLGMTQLKTCDIALRIGYNDPKYFNVIFKRHIGMTPKEYRNSVRVSS
ncbi:response regulator [Paenibacillus frigoriresistens]|uniref:response regulator n=1 Tax=Paenibacillus alginolyticus TaxID=59839 RepID=UPI0015638854|nr:response regulator [Paenibacillus frigoriresistens]NRF93749.1 response regulator [Paenibacillus frigoriresistens]